MRISRKLLHVLAFICGTVSAAELNPESLLAGLQAECAAYANTTSRYVDWRLNQEVKAVGRSITGSLGLEAAINSSCMAYQLGELYEVFDELAPGMLDPQLRSKHRFQIDNLRSLYVEDARRLDTEQFFEAVKSWQRGKLFLTLQEFAEGQQSNYPQDLGAMRLNGFLPFHRNKDVGLIFQYELTAEITDEQRRSIISSLEGMVENGDCTNTRTRFYVLFQNGVTFIHQLIYNGQMIHHEISRFSDC